MQKENIPLHEVTAGQRRLKEQWCLSHRHSHSVTVHHLLILDLGDVVSSDSWIWEV